MEEEEGVTDAQNGDLSAESQDENLSSLGPSERQEYDRLEQEYEDFKKYPEKFFEDDKHQTEKGYFDQAVQMIKTIEKRASQTLAMRPQNKMSLSDFVRRTKSQVMGQ